MLYCRAHNTVVGLLRHKDLLLFLTWFLLPGQAMMTPNMQGVIMAIGKSSSVYEKNGPEAAFFKVHTVSALHVLIPYSLNLQTISLSCVSLLLSFSVYFLTVQKVL